MFDSKCKHKFGPIDGGYQYCKECGIATLVPVPPPPPPPECQHTWQTYGTVDKQNAFGGCIQQKLILQCEHCGDIKTVVIADVAPDFKR